MGVSGTPTVFVNGQHVGEPGKIATYEEIAQAVEQALNE
jgi:protein-disulfide isomerase